MAKPGMRKRKSHGAFGTGGIERKHVRDRHRLEALVLAEAEAKKAKRKAALEAKKAEAVQ